jgi:hypothetical protein
MDARYKGHGSPPPPIPFDWTRPVAGPSKGREVGSFAKPFSPKPAHPSAQEIADSLSLAGFRKTHDK